jgi:glycosyltransferase involved in cell wall biosynthesis
VGLGWRAELLELADRILPNSEAEAAQLVRLFGVDRRRLAVVPNGVDERFAAAGPELFHELSSGEDFVLYAGRIEPRKNVLGLVRASRELGLRLVVLGDGVPGHEGYRRECVRIGGQAVSWWPRMDHEDPRLASAYAAARVFALVSWFETPGLSALEAALAGSRVVVTPFGSTREYFGDRVLYARPDRPHELQRRLASAWERPADPALSRHVAEHFTWPVVARRTAEAYAHIAA